jgi:hypothetical protein
MKGRSPIFAGMFIQKSLEGSGRNRWGRTPSGFPLLQGGEFGWHASGNKSADCLGLAQAVGLPPCLETENHRNRSPLGDGCFVSLEVASGKAICASVGSILPHTVTSTKVVTCWRWPSASLKNSLLARVAEATGVPELVSLRVGLARICPENALFSHCTCCKIPHCWNERLRRWILCAFSG